MICKDCLKEMTSRPILFLCLKLYNTNIDEELSCIVCGEPNIIEGRLCIKCASEYRCMLCGKELVYVKTGKFTSRSPYDAPFHEIEILGKKGLTSKKSFIKEKKYTDKVYKTNKVRRNKYFYNRREKRRELYNMIEKLKDFE